MTEIQKYGACYDAIKYRKQFKTFEEAWDNCPRGDWMLWIAKKIGVDERKLTLAKGLCAKTVIHLMKDDRSKAAVQAAIDYGSGLIDREQLNAAAAADAAAAYTAAAYTDAARTSNRKQTADVCREVLTEEVFKLIHQ